MSQLKMEEIGTWDSVLLENLSEDSFINNIHQRYKNDLIYTYIGSSVVAVNPYHHHHISECFDIRNYGSKGIFQLPPHIYGLANLAFQSLKEQSEDQCIILTGESGSGKTESFQIIVKFLTHIQEDRISGRHLKKQSIVSSANMHRRASSSCSATNFVIRKNSSTAMLMTINPGKPCRPTSSPSPPSRRCNANPTTVIKQRSRAESSDRGQLRRNTREKMVDFDFSHHKSTESISFVDYSKLHCSHAHSHSYSDKYPTKSCFKHFQTQHQAQQQMQQLSCIAAAANSSARSETASASPKYTLSAATSLIPAGCRLCGHSKCMRAQSLEKDDQELLLKSCNNRFISSYKPHVHRNSCSNLLRQQSTESQTEYPLLTGSNQRISLYDAHELSQMRLDGISLNCLSANAQSSSSPMSKPRRQTVTEKLRERVAFAYVFLEAMGNATTVKNDNSSRYGKFFDIEIDFKGDPIGVHITHYSCNQHKCGRA